MTKSDAIRDLIDRKAKIETVDEFIAWADANEGQGLGLKQRERGVLRFCSIRPSLSRLSANIPPVASARRGAFFLRFVDGQWSYPS